MVWTEILTAFALVLIIEGLLPFASPNRYRQMVAQLVMLGDNHIRTVGLVIIVIGLVMLFVVRN
ncbi:MAG: DUF2065 domain-containing protein [Gammaproteobacteria bacterium]|nr:DUF2065 domain-containing protein [Gammaproteobacteria bacterium]NNC77083.1 DUF2065 domain-containing protein [Woeseiaceae bacterium]